MGSPRLVTKSVRASGVLPLKRRASARVVIRRLSRPWWIDPAGFLLLIILPLFLLSAIFGAPLMPQFDNVNFLTDPLIVLGAVSITIFALGAKIGSGTAGPRTADQSLLSFDPRRYDQSLIAIVVVALAAHLLLLAQILTNPQLILDVSAGVRGANFEAEGALFRVLGVTSLTNLSMLALSMSSIRFVERGAFAPSPILLLAIAALGPLIVIHAFIGSERLVLVENGVAFMLPLFSFWPRLRRIGPLVPPFGLLLVIAIFAIGEYQRSWAFYKNFYNSFTEFATLRFFAYVAGAANTGAGMVAMMDPVGHPEVTGRWMSALVGAKTSHTELFLQKYGNIEFNNPSGIFAAMVDFGPAGILYIFTFGVVAGALYKLYLSRNPVGMLAYPIFFIGFTDLTQVWYWGEPRFIPQLAALLLVLAVTLRRQSLVRST